MTLIETLVGLTISVVVMALVFTSLRTVHRVMRGQQGRSEQRSAYRTLHRLSRELSCAVAAGQSNSPIFQLTHEEGSLSPSIEFCTAAPHEKGLTRKLYYLEAGDYKFPELVCRSWPLRGPGSLSTGIVEHVVSDVHSFEVLALDGKDWLKTWKGKAEQVFPKAVRIGIAVDSTAGAVSNSVMILMPASLEFHSTVERGSAQ